MFSSRGVSSFFSGRWNLSFALLFHLGTCWWPASHQCSPVLTNWSLASVLRRLQSRTSLCCCLGSLRSRRHSVHSCSTFHDLPNLCGRFGVWSSPPATLPLPKRNGMLACMCRGLSLGGYSLTMVGRLDLLAVGDTCILRLSRSKLLRLLLFACIKNKTVIKVVQICIVLIFFGVSNFCHWFFLPLFSTHHD